MFLASCFTACSRSVLSTSLDSSSCLRSGSDEPRHFLLTQYCGHPPLTLGKRNVIGKIRPSECLDEEKTQSSGTKFMVRVFATKTVLATGSPDLPADAIFSETVTLYRK